MVFWSLFVSFVLCVPYMSCVDEWANCSFENSWCKWKNDPVGDGNWIMATPTPTSPFNRAQHGNYYLYANTTGLRKGAKVGLNSPDVGINGVVCMKFRINSLTVSPGNLLVKSSSELGRTLHLTINSFQKKFWQCIFLAIQVTERTKISIEMEETGAKPAIIGLDFIQFIEPSLCRGVCTNVGADALDIRLINSSHHGTGGDPKGPYSGGPHEEPTRPLPDQTTLQMGGPTIAAQVQSDMMTWLPAFIVAPVCVVVVIVTLFVWYFRCFKNKQKEKAKQKQQSVLSQLSSRDNNTNPAPFTEEDEYGYVSVISANPYTHYYSTMKDPKDTAIPKDHPVVRNTDVQYSYDDYMKPRNGKQINYVKPKDDNGKFSQPIESVEGAQNCKNLEPPDIKIWPSYQDYNGYLKPSNQKRNTYLAPLNDQSVPLDEDYYMKPRKSPCPSIADYMKPIDQKPELPRPRKSDYM